VSFLFLRGCGCGAARGAANPIDGEHRSFWCGLVCFKLMAASMLVVALVLVLFVIAQRYFVEGIALTGILG
jgi:hypothetical protein